MMRSVRATRSERARALPGDELIARPIDALSNGITIDRSPREIWPWLAQMGADRAGWYSYDRLDNGGRPSANRTCQSFKRFAKVLCFPLCPEKRAGSSCSSRIRRVRSCSAGVALTGRSS